MIQFWWKSIRWLTTLGIMLWFVMLPFVPVYGLLRPWPQAQEKLKEEGITGLALMIGAGSESEYSINGSGESWLRERQRSYVVLPYSFHQLEIVTYSEMESSSITGVKKEIFRSRWLVPLFVFWILAGLFSVIKIKGWARKKQPLQ